MTDRPPLVLQDAERYAQDHTTPDAPHLAALAEETRATMPGAGMMVGPLEGRFLATLVFLTRAQRVLEIGTFTGYSALSMAAALGDGGRIVTCEVNEEHAAVARRHIAASPYADRIDVRLGPAIETIRGLDGPFDLVFIDADKTGYLDYYEAVLPLLSEHGLIVADNVLWQGRVFDPAVDDADTAALRRFAGHVRDDPRVECVMVTIRDGVLLIRRRP